VTAGPRLTDTLVDYARRLERRVAWPRGWPQNPMTDAQWMAKFTALATSRCTPAEAAPIAALTLGIQEVPGVRTLGAAPSLSGDAGRGDEPGESRLLPGR
jgi:hypothetical protein